MFIISQDKNHFINLDHIISVDVQMDVGNGVAKLFAYPAIQGPQEERYPIGTFKSVEDAQEVLEFLAFCKARGENKITAIPPADKVNVAKKREVKIKLDDIDGDPFKEILMEMLEGGI